MRSALLYWRKLINEGPARKQVLMEKSSRADKRHLHSCPQLVCVSVAILAPTFVFSLQCSRKLLKMRRRLCLYLAPLRRPPPFPVRVKPSSALWTNGRSCNEIQQKAVLVTVPVVLMFLFQCDNFFTIHIARMSNYANTFEVYVCAISVCLCFWHRSIFGKLYSCWLIAAKQSPVYCVKCLVVKGDR